MPDGMNVNPAKGGDSRAVSMPKVATKGGSNEDADIGALSSMKSRLQKSRVSLMNILSTTEDLPDIASATKMAQSLNIKDMSGASIKEIISSFNFNRGGISKLMGAG